MYKSPISIDTDLTFPAMTAREQLTKDAEDAVYSAVAEMHIKVDRAELIRALDYDRRQYEQGFRDGYKAVNEQALGMMIRTLERNAGQSTDEKLEIWEKIQKLKAKSDAAAYIEGMSLAEEILQRLEAAQS